MLKNVRIEMIYMGVFWKYRILGFSDWFIWELKWG